MKTVRGFLAVIAIAAVAGCATTGGPGGGPDKVVYQVTFVPSGVAEITRLQQREGYAYLKP
jgi:hypothetical protein